MRKTCEIMSDILRRAGQGGIFVYITTCEVPKPHTSLGDRTVAGLRRWNNRPFHLCNSQLTLEFRQLLSTMVPNK